MVIPEHYPEVLAEARESLPGQLERANDPNRNAKGLFTLGVAGKYRCMGVIGYLVEREVGAFRSNLAEATKWRMQLFDRFDQGDPISPSLVSMHTYKNLYDALASGEISLASAFAERMGNRPDVEKEFDRSFEVAMGYALKAVLAGDEAAARTRLMELTTASNHKDYINFVSYASILDAILSKDAAAAEAAFPELLSAHRRESRGRGLFSGLEDEFISVWGLGLLQLAKSRGLEINVTDALLPYELTA